MRNLNGCLTAVLVLLAAGAAVADVSPDVEVRLVSPLVAVKAGDAYEGKLEIAIGQDGRLEGVQLGGDGWATTLDRVPADGPVKAGDVVTVTFRAVALDAERRLEFRCEFDGYPVRAAFDLSERNVRAMTEGGAVRETPDALDRPGDRSRGPTDDLLGPARIGTAPADKRTITVSGRFGTILDGGGFYPAHSILIEVWDWDNIGADDLLGSGYTNFDGYYSIDVESTDGDLIGDPDIYVRFILNNTRVRVYEPTSGDDYWWQSGRFDDYAGTDLDLGTLIPADPNQNASIFLHTQGTRSWVHDYLLGYDVPACRIEWPSAAWPNCSPTGRIQMRNDFSWRDGVLWHEYGHWFDHEMASWEPFDYCNGVCDGADCGHCFWCDESQVIAWLEGWAQFHGWAVSDWMPGYYGFTPLSPIDAEDLGTCGGSYDDPLLTEGFIAALCQDIADSAQDTHGVYGDYTDSLAKGVSAVFAVNANDNPTGSQDFADKYVARYPGDRAPFWETAANCGYAFDSTAPGAVTGLGSSSHVVGVASPDPTPTFTWTRASDDYSGISGYGIAISTGGPVFPSAIEDIGDVTSYTSDPLSPGTYYFSIRAVDNAGYWSGSYAWWGPFTIREPDPADLAPYLASGWDYTLVPRTLDDTTTGYAPLPASLPGDAPGTYWNVFGQNQGEVATGSGFWGQLSIDGESGGSVYWSEISSGGLYYGPNRGPITVQAGRHAMTFRHDSSDLVAETNEANNVVGRQFVWTTASVDAQVLVARDSPPPPYGGWGEVTGGALHLNCDGLAMPTGTGWWHAMAVWADDHGNDFDCRLHDPSTGPEDGLAAYLEYSASGAGYLDAVLVNRNVHAGATWDVGVTSWSGTGPYQAYHASSSIMSFGDSITVALSEDQPILLREFYLFAEYFGPVSVTAYGDPGDGPLRLAVLNSAFDHGTLYSGDQLGSDTTDGSGLARVSVDLASTGWYGIAVYRDPSGGLPARDVTLEISTTPPDLTTWTPAGWYATLTPRPLDDGTNLSCPMPDTLQSAPGATYMNLAAQNLGPVSSVLPTRLFRDDVFLGWVDWPTLPSGAQVSYNWTAPFQLTAGRHVLSLRVDALQAVEETDEANNVHGEQWIWGPAVMDPPAATIRSAPPVTTAGWGDMAPGELLYYNCDGLRLGGTGSGFWKAMAILPSAGSDFDLRLHETGTGAKSGFATMLGGSFYAGSAIDYVLVDFNTTASRDFDVGVLRYSGSGSYRAHAAASTYIDVEPQGTWGPFAIPDGGVVDLVEFYFPVESYRVTVENLSGADLGVAVHQEGVAYQSRSQAMDDGDIAGPGGDELAWIEVPTASYCVVAVYRIDQGGGEAPYTLSITNEYASDVDDGEAVPSGARLTGAWPNPFNPQTTLSYTLSERERVALTIFDAQGRLVRRLVDEVVSAGTHQAVWSGLDDQGRRVPSGVYFARLDAPSGRSLAKVMMVK